MAGKGHPQGAPKAAGGASNHKCASSGLEKREGRPAHLSKAAVDHRAKQLNPNNPVYAKCRRVNSEERTASLPKYAADFRAKQLNPNNPLYHKCRGAENIP